MNIRFFILSIVTLPLCFSVEAQDFQWVKDILYDSFTDSRLTIAEENEVVLTKNFSDKIAIGNSKLESFGKQDFAITKYDSKGKSIWTKHFGGKGVDEVRSIQGDNQGNLIIAGSFSESISLGVVQLISKGQEDIFIAKLDKKGNCIWAKAYGNKGRDEVAGLELDNLGNSIVFGSAVGERGQDLSNELFVTKYNQEGKLLWNKKFKSTEIRTVPKAITCDSLGHLILAGVLYDNLTYEGTPLFLESHLPEGIPHVFLVRLDKEGNFIWSNNLSAVDFDSFITMESALTCDKNNSIYLGGAFIGSIRIDNKLYYSSGIGNQDVFIAACSSAGMWKWVQTSKGDDSNYGRDHFVTLKAHKNGLVYGAGYFDGVLKLGDRWLNENKELYDSDLFIIAIDSLGKIIWSKQGGVASKSLDKLCDIAVSDKEDIYFTGYSKGNPRFDKIQLKSSHASHSYLGKIGKSERSIEKELSSASSDSLTVLIYPNPSLSEDIIVKVEGIGEKCKIELYDSKGKSILQLYQGKTKKKELYQFTIKASELQEGLYLLKVISDNGTSSHKIIISK